MKTLFAFGLAVGALIVAFATFTVAVFRDFHWSVAPMFYAVVCAACWIAGEEIAKWNGETR